MAVTELSDTDQQLLRQRREEFWSWVARIATGGFIALAVWSAVVYALIKLWLDSTF